MIVPKMQQCCLKWLKQGAFIIDTLKIIRIISDHYSHIFCLFFSIYSRRKLILGHQSTQQSDHYCQCISIVIYPLSISMSPLFICVDITQGNYVYISCVLCHVSSLIFPNKPSIFPPLTLCQYCRLTVPPAVAASGSLQPCSDAQTDNLSMTIANQTVCVAYQ